jgi:hypothetical protein
MVASDGNLCAVIPAFARMTQYSKVRDAISMSFFKQKWLKKRMNIAPIAW